MDTYILYLQYIAHAENFSYINIMRLAFAKWPLPRV